MTYYLMTKEQIIEYVNLYDSVSEAHMKACKELGYQYVSTRDSYTKRSNFTNKMKVAHQPETDHLNMMPIAIGKKKAEVIKSATIIAEQKGMTEAYVKNIGWSTEWGEYEVRQSWFIYKENGKWFFKMREDCKAKHEVA